MSYRNEFKKNFVDEVKLFEQSKAALEKVLHLRLVEQCKI